MKTPKGAKTKTRIIEAAVELLMEKGVEKTTLVEICSKSNVAQGTFYHYFKSINDILYEILRIEGDEMVYLYDQIKSEVPDLKLWKILDFQLNYYDKKGKAVVAQILKNEFIPYSGESMIERLLPTRKFVAAIISEGTASGGFQPSAPAEIISFEIMALILTYTALWIRESEDKTLRDLIGPHLKRFVERNLYC